MAVKRTGPTQRDFSTCKRLGHAMDDLGGPPLDVMSRMLSKPGMWDVWVRCLRCTTVRHDYVSVTGTIYARQYHYPNGYRWEGAPGEAPTRADWRLERIKELRSLGQRAG